MRLGYSPLFLPRTRFFFLLIFILSPSFNFSCKTLNCSFVELTILCTWLIWANTLSNSSSRCMWLLLLVPDCFCSAFPGVRPILLPVMVTLPDRCKCIFLPFSLPTLVGCEPHHYYTRFHAVLVPMPNALLNVLKLFLWTSNLYLDQRCPVV